MHGLSITCPWALLLMQPVTSSLYRGLRIEAVSAVLAAATEQKLPSSDRPSDRVHCLSGDMWMEEYILRTAHSEIERGQKRGDMPKIPVNRSQLYPTFNPVIVQIFIYCLLHPGLHDCSGSLGETSRIFRETFDQADKNQDWFLFLNPQVLVDRTRKKNLENFHQKNTL